MSNVLVKADDLESQITEALKSLNAKQRLFVENFAAGGNATQAAIKAGYSIARARKTASRLVTDGDFVHVQLALDLLRRKYALEHGLPAAWKRRALVDTYSHAREINQPSAANQTLRTLCEMDGDIRTPANTVPGNVQININTGILRDENDVIEEITNKHE